jgi:hypothetical protein
VSIIMIIAMVRLLLRPVVSVVCQAIGVRVGSVRARHLGVGIGGGRERVRATHSRNLVGSTQ